jgi:hypothetical protein
VNFSGTSISHAAAEANAGRAKGGRLATRANSINVLLMIYLSFLSGRRSDAWPLRGAYLDPSSKASAPDRRTYGQIIFLALGNVMMIDASIAAVREVVPPKIVSCEVRS